MILKTHVALHFICKKFKKFIFFKLCNKKCDSKMKKFKNIIFILFLIFKTCFCFKNNFENSFTTPSEIVSENPCNNLKKI